MSDMQDALRNIIATVEAHKDVLYPGISQLGWDGSREVYMEPFLKGTGDIDAAVAQDLYAALAPAIIRAPSIPNRQAAKDFAIDIANFAAELAKTEGFQSAYPEGDRFHPESLDKTLATVLGIIDRQRTGGKTLLQ